MKIGTWLKTACAALAALTLLLGTPGVLEAQGTNRGQSRPEGERGFDRGQLEQRVMQQFQETVSRELGLDSAGSAALFGVVESVHEERRTLGMRERQLRRQLSGTAVYLSEQESSRALDELLSIKREELRLYQVENERMRELLTAPQILRFHTLREEMGERIRGLRSSPGGGPGGPGGGA